MASGPIEVRVLAGGSVAVDGVDVPLAPLQRRLLVILTEGPRAGLSTGELIDRLWDGEAPPSAAASIRNSVSRVRTALGTEAIDDGPAGYRLGRHVDTDISRLSRLAAAPGSGDAELAEALATLDRCESTAPHAGQVQRLRDAIVDRRCDRALHSAGPTVAELDAWCAERPDREQRWSALVATLIRLGRRREALAAIDRARRALAGFGLEPGVELLRLERVALGSSATVWSVDPVAAARSPRRLGSIPAGFDTSSLIDRDELVDRLTTPRATDDPSAVVLTGPSGIGKTSVALAIAERLGAPTRYVRFDRDDAGALSALRRELADALPALARPAATAPGADRAHFIGDVVADLRDAVADGAILVLDDLHEADPLTFVLLRRLLLDEVELPIHLIATVRTDVDRPPPLESLLERAGRHHRLTVAPVPPLDVDGVAALVASIRPDAVRLAPAIAERSGGNPYLATTIARRLGPHPEQLPDPSAGGSPSHDELLRLGLVESDAIDVVELLAVVGREADLAVLAVALGVPRVDVSRRLRPAVALRLVTIDGDRASFEHDLVRGALLDGMTGERRRSLHATAALAAEDAVGEPVERSRLAARHWLSAGPPFDRRAVPHVLVAARDAVATFAFEDAVESIRAALATGPIDDVSVRAELHVLLGRALAELARFDDAAAAFDAGFADAIEAGDDDLVARAALGATGAFTDLDVGDDRLALLDEALEAVTDPRARLTLLARDVLLRHGAGERSAEAAAEAVELADALGDPESMMRAMDARSIVVATRPGHAADVLVAAERMGDAADAAGLVQAGFVARMRRVRADIELGRLDDARSVLDDVAAWPDRHLVDLDRWILLSHQSVHALARDDVDEAEDLAVQGRALGVRIDVAEAKPWFALQLLGIRLRQGREAELASMFAAGVDQTDAVSWWLAASTTSSTGDAVRAHELIDRFEDCVEQVRRDHLWPGTLALYRLACARLDREVAVEQDAVRALPDSAVLFGAACTLVPPGAPGGGRT